MTYKNWALVKRSSIIVPKTANTTAGAYRVIGFGKTTRKFYTRDAARDFKRTLTNPDNYSIVNTVSNYVSR